jgi:short subunit fatty acids transporter|tara:strand:+ start:253 stop:414 length:162 start_codon:yes stop_codon:yes gene_type:complete
MDQLALGIIIIVGICLFYVFVAKCICPSQDDILSVQEEFEQQECIHNNIYSNV